MQKIRGVNLGGWLILERWMTPSLFDGLEARDEYEWCDIRSNNKRELLTRHRDTFITEDDIRWIQERGLNAVRLPVPYWLFEDQEPYLSCRSHVDWLLDACQQYNISVLLDLHAAPGSQNGCDHSGRVGAIDWTKLDNIDKTLQIFEQLVQTYGQHPAVWGFETLNEPDRKMSLRLLAEYYQQAQQIVLKHAPSKQVFGHDSFRPEAWKDGMLAKSGFGLDMHLYEAFNARRTMTQHLQTVRREWAHIIASTSEQYPVIIGEWSLGLNPKSFRGMGDFERDKALQAFAHAQLEVFEAADAWFFWNYKTEQPGGWNFRDCVSRGWLPASFTVE